MFMTQENVPSLFYTFTLYKYDYKNIDMKQLFEYIHQEL